MNKLLAILATVLILPQSVAHAQAWPNKPVKWILSQPAGSGPDVMSRYVAEHLSKALGQPIVIENRPGGQNVIGAQAAAKSAPDGYTFYYGTTAAIVTNVYTFKNLPYDPKKEFMPVAMVGKSPFLIAASPAANVKTLAEAIALAKAQPDKVAIGTEGPKTFSGMLADMVASLGLTPLGRYVSYAVAGVDPGLMGIGPVAAAPRALARAGLSLDAIDRIELNEAFASQVVAVIRELGLSEERVNPNGGALAIGHPLGASGARLVGTLLRELGRSDGRYGLATLCVGGGMGAAMVLERAGRRI